MARQFLEPKQAPQRPEYHSPHAQSDYSRYLHANPQKQVNAHPANKIYAPGTGSGTGTAAKGIGWMNRDGSRSPVSGMGSPTGSLTQPYPTMTTSPLAQRQKNVAASIADGTFGQKQLEFNQKNLGLHMHDNGNITEHPDAEKRLAGGGGGVGEGKQAGNDVPTDGKGGYAQTSGKTPFETPRSAPVQSAAGQADSMRAAAGITGPSSSARGNWQQGVAGTTTISDRYGSGSSNLNPTSSSGASNIASTTNPGFGIAGAVGNAIQAAGKTTNAPDLPDGAASKRDGIPFNPVNRSAQAPMMAQTKPAPTPAPTSATATATAPGALPPSALGPAPASPFKGGSLAERADATNNAAGAKAIAALSPRPAPAMADATSTPKVNTPDLMPKTPQATPDVSKWMSPPAMSAASGRATGSASPDMAALKSAADAEAQANKPGLDRVADAVKNTSVNASSTIAAGATGAAGAAKDAIGSTAAAPFNAFGAVKDLATSAGSAIGQGVHDNVINPVNRWLTGSNAPGHAQQAADAARRPQANDATDLARYKAENAGLPPTSTAPASYPSPPGWMNGKPYKSPLSSDMGLSKPGQTAPNNPPTQKIVGTEAPEKQPDEPEPQDDTAEEGAEDDPNKKKA